MMDIGKKIFYPKTYPLNKDLSKKWIVRYYEKSGDELKKRVKRVPTSLKTVEERGKWATDLIKKLEKGLQTKIVVENANKHIQRLFEIIEEKKVKNKTKTSYRGHVQGLNTYCIENNIKSITNQVANDFLESLSESHEGRTVNHYRRTLLELFAKLKKNKEIKSNPFDDTLREKTKKAFSEHWSDADIALIIQHTKLKEPQLLLPISVILHCATRNGKEMPNIRVKDIDFEKSVLWIDSEFAKNKEREQVKIPNNLMRTLQRLNIESYNREYYLFTRTGTPGLQGIGQNYLNRKFKEILNEIGINKKGKGFYRLKNSLAVKLVKEKVNTFAIKTQFRHKSFKTTEEYLKSLNVSDFPELDNFSFF
jgi:integrase